MTAYIVTFEHCGMSYNVWVWPAAETFGTTTAQVSCRATLDRSGGWAPIELDGGTVQPVEVQS